MPPPSPDDYAAALEYFRARVIMTDDEWAELQGSLRDQAFKIAGVNQLSLVTDVWFALDDAIAKGTSFAEFKREVGDKLADAWGGPKPWRLDAIFRTWTQKAYGAGRYEVMTDPEVKRQRPFWKFIAIEDGRICVICQECDETVLPADHPWWYTHNAPLHVSCRCTAVTLTPEEAAGKADDPAPDADPADGFGGPPTVPYDPDLSKYPPPLVAKYLQKVGS